MPHSKDPEEDYSDVSLEEGIVEEDEHIDDDIENKDEMLRVLDKLADKLGYDIDGRDRPDDALFDNMNEAAAFSPIILCGESYEMECIVLWDYFGGNSFDDLNVHAGDTVHVVAEEYQLVGTS
uniref:SH3 domain-containing protein n=1 Tax=Caenorhabditis tropicalis TaxID=1561998 RepID=A0A1I7TMQ1_9PELO